MRYLGASCLLAISVLAPGCTFGRGGSQLLEARLRQQATEVSRLAQQLDDAQDDLTIAQKEVRQLRAELAKQQRSPAPSPLLHASYRAKTLTIQPLVTAIIPARDGRPAELTVLLIPIDEDGEAIKLAGEVELTLVDPAASSKGLQLGRWVFAAEETESKWSNGLLSRGFRFTVPCPEVNPGADLVLRALLKNIDGDDLTTVHVMRVPEM